MDIESIDPIRMIELPEWDEKKLCPKTKMPNCEHCGEDELGMLDKNHAFCYCCGRMFERER